MTTVTPDCLKRSLSVRPVSFDRVSSLYVLQSVSYPINIPLITDIILFYIIILYYIISTFHTIVEFMDIGLHKR